MRERAASSEKKDFKVGRARLQQWWALEYPETCAPPHRAPHTHCFIRIVGSCDDNHREKGCVVVMAGRWNSGGDSQALWNCIANYASIYAVWSFKYTRDEKKKLINFILRFLNDGILIALNNRNTPGIIQLNVRIIRDDERVK